jgi:FMN reductase
MMNIVMITGTPAEFSRLNGVIEAAHRILAVDGWRIQELHVRSLPPEDLIYARFDSPAIIEANRMVAEADAFVVATPVYKAAYTGVLKTYLDLIPQKGLDRKSVFPIAIGGTMAHFLAIDFALKPVLSALGADHISTGVFVLDSQVSRLENGGFSLDDELTARLTSTLKSWMHDVKCSSAGRNLVQA